ncbi:MAG: hypothetical protein AVDCRST_MAG64-922, partial [uncultured Phycisphaerae bacterium]
HARPAAPRVRRRAGRAHRGPLGAHGGRHAVGGVLHRDRRGRRRGELLGPRGRRPPELRRLRRPRDPRVLHARALPQARGRAHRRPPARRALRPLLRGGLRRPRGGRARQPHHHLPRRGVAPARGHGRGAPL